MLSAARWRHGRGLLPPDPKLAPGPLAGRMDDLHTSSTALKSLKASGHGIRSQGPCSSHGLRRIQAQTLELRPQTSQKAERAVFRFGGLSLAV